MLKLNDIKYYRLIISFVIFCSLFITLRLLALGSAGSETVPQFIISTLPELFACIILTLLYFRRPSKFRLGNLILVDKIFLGFILLNILIGSIVSADLKMIIYGIRMTYFPMLFYFVLRFESRDFIYKTIHQIFVVLSFVGLAGLIIYFLFYDVMINMILMTGGEVGEYFITRMTSIFWTPVVFSTCMSAGFIYFLWKYLIKGENISLVHIAITWSCLLFSVSRGSLVVVVIGFIILSIFCFEWRRFLVSFLLMAILFLMVALYIGSPIEYVKWIISSTTETVSLKEGVSRVDLWIHAFENFKNHPLGYGIGKAGHVAARFYAQNTSEADVFSTDGWFLKLANETGIIGLISYFSLCLTIFIEFLRTKFYKQPELILLFTFFVIYNIQNLVSNVLDFYLFAFLFWILIGVFANHLNDLKKHEA